MCSSVYLERERSPLGQFAARETASRARRADPLRHSTRADLDGADDRDDRAGAATTSAGAQDQQRVFPARRRSPVWRGGNSPGPLLAERSVERLAERAVGPAVPGGV